MSNNGRRALSLVLLLLLSTGCSIKLAYNNADRLIRWNVDDYVDLTNAQKTFLDGELQRLLYWHRTTQLPAYAHALRRLNADIATAVGGADSLLIEDFEGFIETALAWGETVQDRAERTVSQVLLSLSSEQISDLPRRFEKNNREMKKEEQDKSLLQSQARWEKSVRKGLQRFMGRLNSEQQVFLQGQAERYQPEQVLWVEYRTRWQEEMQRLLRQWRSGELGSEEALAAFAAHADARESYYGAYGPVWENNQALGLATTAGLLVRMRERQASRFSQNLLAIVEDLEELVSEASPESPLPMELEECLVVHSGCPGQPAGTQP